MSSAPSNCMIPATPDVSGFSVRLSLYIQSLLCFIPPVLAVLGKRSYQDGLDLSERLTTTNLILAFSILGSSVVQALNDGLTNYHANIVLKLGWLGVCNLVTFTWMYIKCKMGQSSFEYKRLRMQSSFLEAGPAQPSEKNDGETRSTLLKKTLILFGGAFMGLVSFFGIWLWQEPGYFGPAGTHCATNAIVVRMPLFGNLRVALGSGTLRAWYLVLYGVFLAVVAPSLVVSALSTGCLGVSCRLARRTASKYPKTLICLFLLIISTILEIEVTVKENQHLQVKDDDSWNLGQVLALVLVMVPVRDIIRAISATRTQRVGAHDYRGLPKDLSDLKDDSSVIHEKGATNA